MKADKKIDQLTSIDGKTFKKMLISSLKILREQKDFINSLNVFPVPDGDTGTNMYLTFVGGIKKVKKARNKISKITISLSQGALMEARGNSGVILSQLLRGFSRINKNNEKMNREDLVKSLRKASEIAYQGVMKPVEGTILTVSKGAARGAEKALENNLDIIGIFQNCIQEAQKTLDNTPEQLPALKEAGVVDAGGQGYLFILKGMLKALTGEIDIEEEKIQLEKIEGEKEGHLQKDNLKYTYDTQLLVNLEQDFKDLKINNIRNKLQQFGDSLIVVGSDDTLKIHIHSNNPGSVLEYAKKWGDLRNIDIENMELESNTSNKNNEEINFNNFDQEVDNDDFENEDLMTEPQNNSENPGFVSVASGEGIKGIFYDLGVEQIINGGQSMNPSTSDFMEAIKNIDKEDIIIFPNNKNVISAANQASSLSDKNVEVVPTTSFPEAIAALILQDSEQNFNELISVMNSEIKDFKTFKITEAIKDSSIENMDIEKGDIIGIYQDDIKIKGSNYQQVIDKLFNEFFDDEDLITIYYGQDVEENDLNKIINALENKYDLIEIESYFGGQTLYPYIISIE